MEKPIVFTIIESASPLKISHLFDEMGYEEMQFSSVRKAIKAIKKHKPDVIIAPFFYAYANNYASNHISNLDSLLITLQTYSDYHPKFIFLVDKKETEFVERLIHHYDGFSNLSYPLVLPVTEQQVRDVLSST